MKLSLSFILAFLSFSASATVEVLVRDNYTQIRQEIMAAASTTEPRETLIVFDIDETILVVEDCLIPEENSGFARWLKMAHQCAAKLTEERIDDDIKAYQLAGFATIALTARADNLRLATERELSRYGIKFLGYPFTAEANFEHPFTQRSKVVFKDGVTYASNKNKGETLKILQQKLPRSFKKVIFIDDGIKNIRAMTRAYEADQEVHVQIIHYTRYNEAAE